MMFISYSWKDKEKVKPIYELIINSIGTDKVFIDFDKNTHGSNYWKNINNAITTSKYFLFFNSSNYDNSSACARELLLALELEKLNEENFKILEVKLDDTRSHPSLIHKIYKKFTTNEDVYESIINAITKSDFKGFERNKLSKIISQKILADSSLEIIFNVTRKVMNPKFILLTEKNRILNLMF